MNYTQHYQLPQWVDSDRIMMDDFNDMTAKLDSGLAAAVTAAAEANCYIRLLQLTTTENLTRINLPLTGIEPENFHRMDLYVFPGQTGDGWADTVYLRANGLDSGYLYGHDSAAQLAIGGLSTEAGGFGYLCFHLYLGQKILGTADYFFVDHSYFHDGNVNETFSETFYALEQPPASLQSLQIDGWSGGTAPFPAGTKVQLYGWRK